MARSNRNKLNELVSTIEELSLDFVRQNPYPLHVMYCFQRAIRFSYGRTPKDLKEPIKMHRGPVFNELIETKN